MAKQSNSRKAQLQRQLSYQLQHAPITASWTPSGFVPDIDLLAEILAITDPTDVRGGSVATGLDLWTSKMFRDAGFESVRPGAVEPYFATPADAAALMQLTKARTWLKDLEASASRMEPESRKLVRTTVKAVLGAITKVEKNVGRPTSSVLGESRKKQVDVFLADVDRGLELLVSTKTIALNKPDDVIKNLPNRWEEFDGDLKNLRGRFPLAAIGALVLLPSIVVRELTLDAFVDMMQKLTAPGRPWANAYDRAAILIVDPWEAGTRTRVDFKYDEMQRRLPLELQIDGFFNALIDRLLERSPIAEHVKARALRAEALGNDSSGIQVSADRTNAAMEDTLEYDPGVQES